MQRLLLTLIIPVVIFSNLAHAASTNKKFYIYGGATYGITYHEPDALMISKSNSSYFDTFSVMLFDNFGLGTALYLPVTHGLLLGLGWTGSYNSGLTFNSENIFSTFTTLGLTTMIFPQGQNGQGLYIRGDLGRGVSTLWEGRVIFSKSNTKLNSFVGMGITAEIGYAFGGEKSWLLGVQGQMHKNSTGTFSALHLSAGYLF